MSFFFNFKGANYRYITTGIFDNIFGGIYLNTKNYFIPVLTRLGIDLMQKGSHEQPFELKLPSKVPLREKNMCTHSPYIYMTSRSDLANVTSYA